jgi:hypothetical protein
MDSDLAYRRLEKRRDALVERLRGLGNLMRGTVYTTYVRCGAPKCECATGEKHAKLHLSVNLKGRTRTAYVGERRAQQVEALIAEYHRAWRIIEELTEVNLELLRTSRRRRAGKEGRA